MASIATDPAKRRRIQFSDQDGKRQTLRLGKVSMKQCELVRGHVEELANAKAANTAVPKATVDWVAGLGDVLHARLERVGLVEPRIRPNTWTVAAWVRKYIEGKVDATESTICNMKQAEVTLAEYLGSDKRLEDVTAADAEGYASFLRARKCKRGSPDRRMAEATVRRQCRRAKQFFAGAVDARVLVSNPLAKLKCADVVDKSRQRYVSEAEINALLDACPDTDWKLVLALAYYGGLRCPSEIHALTWADVNWSTKHLTVRSKKTRRDSHGGIRHVPVCPELATLLLAAFSEAGEGAEQVIARPLNKANLRTTLYKFMDRAGVERFGKPFQNMRCSCETNWLSAGIPEYQVSEWIGHEVSVSRRHYDIVRREYAELVTGGGAKSGAQKVQNTAQQPTAGNRTESRDGRNALQTQGLCEAMRDDAGICISQTSPTRT